MPVPPPVYPPSPVYPSSPDYRGRQDVRLGDELIAAELAAMRLEARSRSRGKSDAPLYEHPGWYKWQLEQKKKEEHEAEQRKYWEARRKIEYEEAEKERERVIAEHDRALANASAKKKEEERRVIERLEREKKEAREEEKRIVEKLAREEKEREEREERQWKEFEQKQKEKKEKADRQAKAEKEKIETAMRNRLLEAGYSLEEANAMIDGKKKEKPPATIKVPTDEIVVRGRPHHVPVFAKIHKKYLDLQTLRYYNIPYEMDRANEDYIIILQEMSEEDTDLLFEHTRRLRKGKLLLEPAKRDNKGMAWVRRRDKSVGRRDLRVLELRR